jgi:hypothetical protein
VRTRILLTAAAIGAAVLAIVFAVSASEAQPRLARVVACLQKAGYRTTTPIHDSGRRSVVMVGQDPDIQVLGGGSDAVRQVREPSDTFTVVDRASAAVADIRVPRSSPMTFRPDGRIPARARTAIERCLAF